MPPLRVVVEHHGDVVANVAEVLARSLHGGVALRVECEVEVVTGAGLRCGETIGLEATRPAIVASRVRRRHIRTLMSIAMRSTPRSRGAHPVESKAHPVVSGAHPVESGTGVGAAAGDERRRAV